MASSVTGPTLAERADIHKSCKSIEALLNILNEYCEAVGAVVVLQKKLAKSLRETASLKVTGDVAANAMHASANIFEALADVDSKFSKVADKEYDIVSSEVKKWFKKLAKEERLHDDRMANANVKIKQAGQAYEKKSKKKAMDASEEHARYINLISTLGPEVSQEKYNHALNVTQKHTTATFNVAACLSRLADTEWQKSCECVRRFSPTIGPLGQWRSLCEGGWIGPTPPDLPDLDISNGNPTLQSENEVTGLKPIEEEARQSPAIPQAATTAPESRDVTQQLRIPPPGYSTGPPSASESSNDVSKDQTSSRNSPTSTRLQQSRNPQAPSAEDPPTIYPSNALDPPRPNFVDSNTGSVRSLSAFPTPPSHFPLPPPRQPDSQQSSYFQSTSSSSNLELPPPTQLAESPISANDDDPAVNNTDDTFSRAFRHGPTPATGITPSPPSPGLGYRERPRIPENQVDFEESTRGFEIKPPNPVRLQTTLPAEESNSDLSARREIRHAPSSIIDVQSLNKKLYSQEGYHQDNLEFGALNRTTEVSAQPRTLENARYPHPIEKMDTGTSNGSIVAAMRNRYSNNSGSGSPPPREPPRLPLSVNDLASRYQPLDIPLSPTKARAVSPPVLRQQSLPLLNNASRQAQESYPVQTEGRNPEDGRQRQPLYDDGADAEKRAKERELRERERELELRARELEKDRARLRTLREDERSDEVPYHESSAAQSQSNQFGMRPRERRTSLQHQLQRPPSQMELDDASEKYARGPLESAANSSRRPQPQVQYSYSSTRFGPPSTGGLHIPPSTPQPPHSPRIEQRLPLPSQAESQYESRDRNAENSGHNTNTNSTSGSTHAAYCGCETCSINKYKNSGASGSSQQLRQQQPLPPIDTKPQTQRSDKPSKGGWIRRLSMPVGNAFSSDSKRYQSSNNTSSPTNNYGLGSGVGSSPVSRGLFSMDGKKNVSATALTMSSGASGDRGLFVQEDGGLRRDGWAGRRSYDASNRSMTNIGRP